MSANRTDEATASDRRSVRQYRIEDCAVFWKTDGPFGALSNMAKGFPVRVDSHEVASAEALYQALRFPNNPDVQEKIVRAQNAWFAKQIAISHGKLGRPDWDRVRLRIMRWCLRFKLACNPRRFGAVLLETGERPIVERSSRDRFWGAVLDESGLLVGVNVLGRLLVELRDETRRTGLGPLEVIDAPEVAGLVFLGSLVGRQRPQPNESLAPAQELFPF